MYMLLFLSTYLGLCSAQSAYFTTFNFREEFPQRDVRKLLGDVSGVAIDEKHNTYIFHRGNKHWTDLSFNKKNEFQHKKDGAISEHAIVVVNERGKLIKQLGANEFYMPHGITVDKHSNIYVTDVARHQVLRFPKDSEKPDLVLGTKFVPGHGKHHFCKPTKVQVASNGDIIVADGYCNNRVVKFNKKGIFLVEFGDKVKDVEHPKEGEFNLVHGITLSEEHDSICVADRENHRVQCFSAGINDNNKFGEFLGEIGHEQHLGQVMDVAFLNKGDLLILHIDKSGLSMVSVYGITDGQLNEKFTFVPQADPFNQGFGEGHAVTADPHGHFVVIGSLTKRCDQEEQMCFSSGNNNNKVTAVPYNVFKFTVNKQVIPDWLAEEYGY